MSDEPSLGLSKKFLGRFSYAVLLFLMGQPQRIRPENGSHIFDERERLIESIIFAGMVTRR